MPISTHIHSHCITPITPADRHNLNYKTKACTWQRCWYCRPSPEGRARSTLTWKGNERLFRVTIVCINWRYTTNSFIRMHMAKMLVLRALARGQGPQYTDVKRKWTSFSCNYRHVLECFYDYVSKVTCGRCMMKITKNEKKEMAYTPPSQISHWTCVIRIPGNTMGNPFLRLL